eukprot:TRINITY_DN81954_c0_g1_i1.p1 TRINITY_DN81954_c0_g1~~TRINITY_DN81954_c0_g1_i1.p1  ORF type:complete len:227 (-),score=21.02 TRINITY_DN81954_c0_g1_i1:184-864(-)
MAYIDSPPATRGRDEGRIFVAPELRHMLSDLTREESPKNRNRTPKAGLAQSGRSLPTAAGHSGGDSTFAKYKPQASLLEDPLPSTSSVGAIPWQRATLFGGERVATNSNARRGSAVMFRRPTHSRATPHRRPIFVCGQDGTDPRMCVDIHAPGRFGSFERGQYESKVRQSHSGPSRSHSSPSLGHTDSSRPSSRMSTPASSLGGHSRPGSVQGFLTSAVSSDRRRH